MRLISEDNISNTIILTSFFIITLLMVFTGYFFISNQYKTMDLEIKDTKYRLVELRKEQVKREVDAVIDYIDFRKEHHNIESKDDLANLQKQILAWMPTIRFGTPKDNYIFAYQVYNLRGGEEFATMIVNPNRPDLVGRFISDSYTDAAGVAFRKVALEGIRENGDAFVSYLYKKPGAKELNPKITYFKIYEPWGWIIAAGAYLDDIDTLLAQKKDALVKDVRIDIISTILIFLFFSLIANSLAIVLGKQIEGFFNRYRQKVQEQTDELREFNQTLERRVHEEAVKNKEKEQLLIHKSRFIALGEMVSNIAHQWRQPLSELSVLLMGLKLRYQTDSLDKKMLDKKSEEAEHLIEYMSQTIDDFRNFFAPTKQKIYFNIKKSVDRAINISKAALKHHNILVKVDIKEDVTIFGFENEYEQVLLNLINNAKDALLKKGVETPFIKIELNVTENFIFLSIEDNAGGIEVNPIEKIFEPYFSTKSSAQGTGIGLYMAKLIIEKNMDGVLEVKNGKDGAIFTIGLKKTKKA